MEQAPNGAGGPAHGLELLLILAACCWLWGCSVNPPVRLSGYGNLERAKVSLDVPFFPQTANHCGPAALAAVLGASGVDVTPAQLSQRIYLPKREGSLQIELIATTRVYGRIPFELIPEVDALLAEVDAGRPVLLLQNLGTRTLPVWHYAVLTGYDQHRNDFQLNSGKDQRLWIPAPELLRTWEWGGRWAMVALQPGEFPVPPAAGPQPDPDVARYLRSVADFEAVAGGDAGLPAWLAAARRWPDEPGPALALGNRVYHKGELQEAAFWYDYGLSKQPDNPVLANNLASVLGEAGCARSGEAVLGPFVPSRHDQSRWADAIADTLHELAARPGKDPEFCAHFIENARPGMVL